MKGLLVVLALFCSAATAAEPSRETFAELYAVAYGKYGSEVGGMPLPDRAPVLEPVAIGELREILGCAECRPRAVHRAGKIWYDETLDFARLYDRSILIHELIHYLQWVRLGDVSSCAENARRENEAYMLQQRYLADVHDDIRPVVNARRQFVMLNRCHGEQKP